MQRNDSNRPRARSIAATFLLSSACADFGDLHRPDCDPETMDASPSVVAPPTTTPIDASVVIHGSLETSSRVREFRVAGVPASGLAPNFAQWTIEVSRADAESYREGAFALLPIEITGACGALEHDVSPVKVRLDASAADLTVDVELPAGDCKFIPHSGEHYVEVHVRADSNDVGLQVSLSSTVGVFAGPMPVVLQAGDGISERTLRLFGNGEATGTAYVTANAGGASAVGDESVLIAAPPNFASPSLAILPGATATTDVRSVALLAACSLLTTAPGITVSVTTTEAVVELGAEPSDIPSPGHCGQEGIVAVRVDAAVPVGSGALVSCVDAYERGATLAIEIAAPE